MPTDLNVITYSKFEHEDPRLGRHILHHSKSRLYRAPAKDPRKLQSIKHHSNIPLLDQGNEGSCTGHAIMKALGSDPFWSATRKVLASVNAQEVHMYARGIYCDATKLDPWEGVFEPDDTGSDGLSVAKVAQARGLISGYTHALSLEAALTALAERVVIVGTKWLDGMYDVASDGRLTMNGVTVGGHEYALVELDVPNRRVWMCNSWGEGWGLGGHAWMTWDDLKMLLDDQGDCTIPIPITEPPPQPQPEPAPKVVNLPEDDALYAVMARAMKTKSIPKYVKEKTEPWMKVRKIST